MNNAVEPADERKLFEAWHTERYGFAPKRARETYLSAAAHDRWQGWQARAALAASPTVQSPAPKENA
jgi:hypothetical protein